MCTFSVEHIFNAPQILRSDLRGLGLVRVYCNVTGEEQVVVPILRIAKVVAILFIYSQFFCNHCKTKGSKIPASTSRQVSAYSGLFYS